MKKISAFLLSCLCVGSLWAVADLPEARVTLPYAELSNLLDRVAAVEQAAMKTPPKPPVAVIVHEASYRLNCGAGEGSRLRAAFEISNLSEVWQSVPLMAAGMAIDSIEPADAKVVETDGKLCLLVEPGASASVALQVLPGPATATRGGRTVAEFEAIPAVRSALTVQGVPDGGSVIVTGSVAASDGRWAFGLSSAGGSVRVKLYDSTDVQGAVWGGAVQYLVSELEGDLLVQCQLRLTATDNGRTSEVELHLPAQASVQAVRSPHLGERTATEMTEAGQRLRLHWQEDEATSRVIRLSYTLPRAEGTELWTLSGVTVGNCASWQQAYYFTRFDGLDLQPVEGSWSSVDRVPAWIDEAVGAVNLQQLSFAGAGDLSLHARVLPRMQTSVATVLEADFSTQLVAEGAMLHQADLTIEHGAMASYRFMLPQQGRLLSCEVGGRKTEPLLQADGGLVLLLPKPQAEHATTKVSFSYTSKGPPLNPVEGKAELSLPETSLFTRQLKWAVTLPDEYEATALEGNVVIQAGGRKPGQAVKLSKQIYHGESPYAALYYTRRDLER